MTWQALAQEHFPAGLARSKAVAAVAGRDSELEAWQLLLLAAGERSGRGSQSVGPITTCFMLPLDSAAMYVSTHVELQAVCLCAASSTG